MMRLAGCVVLFNPDDAVLDNVQTYLPFLGMLVAVNNSTAPSRVVDALRATDKVIVLEMGGNKGIACALNAGCRFLVDGGYDVALTMDQDSRFPLRDSARVIPVVESLLGSYAIVGLNFNASPSGPDEEIVEADYWLTSGNFLDLGIYSSFGGFEDDLFIDWVDIEFGHKIKLAGKRLCYLKNFSLEHEIGHPVEVKVFGRTIRSMNHTAVRYYYRFRNSRYLYRRDKIFFGRKYWGEVLVNIPKMLLLESQRGEKLRMIRLGMRDAKKGVLGPMPEVYK